MRVKHQPWGVPNCARCKWLATYPYYQDKKACTAVGGKEASQNWGTKACRAVWEPASRKED